MPCEGDTETADLSAYQRAALVTVRLLSGQRLRTRDVGRLVGLRRESAWKLMGHLSAVPDLALILDDDGFWRLLRIDEL